MDGQRDEAESFVFLVVLAGAVKEDDDIFRAAGIITVVGGDHVALVFFIFAVKKLDVNPLPKSSVGDFVLLTISDPGFQRRLAGKFKVERFI